MRVISGTRKGHKLKSPKGTSVRPTEDKLKESLFNILGFIDDDVIVLDLFGGTGSIGIEFLSRGAQKCYFVDVSSTSIEVIKENLNHTKLIDNANVIRKDGVKAINFFGSQNLIFDYIYLDPPFKNYGLLLNALESIYNNSILSRNGMIIIEHEKELTLDDCILGLVKTDFRDYGSKALSFFKLL